MVLDAISKWLLERGEWIGIGLAAFIILGWLIRIIAEPFIDQIRRREEDAYPILYKPLPDFFIVDEHLLERALSHDHGRLTTEVEEETIETTNADARARAGPIDVGAEQASSKRLRERRIITPTLAAKHLRALKNEDVALVRGLDRREYWATKPSITQKHAQLLEHSVAQRAFIALYGNFVPTTAPAGKLRWEHEGSIGPKWILEASEDAAFPDVDLSEIPYGPSLCFGWIKRHTPEGILVRVISIYK